MSNIPPELSGLVAPSKAEWTTHFDDGSGPKIRVRYTEYGIDIEDSSDSISIDFEDLRWLVACLQSCQEIKDA